MKYFVSIIIFSATLFSCSNNNNEREIAEREQGQKINDSIVNAIYNRWNYTITDLNANVKNQTNDWGIWQSFIQEIQQKPSKNLSAYVDKVDNLTRISDEMLANIPDHLNKPQIGARINNLNTNIKYLNSFISLQNIPLEKIFKIQQAIILDINSINAQIDELVRVTNIPKEIGEQHMIDQIIDTTRRANLNFENEFKPETETPAETQRNNSPR